MDQRRSGGGRACESPYSFCYRPSVRGGCGEPGTRPSHRLRAARPSIPVPGRGIPADERHGPHLVPGLPARRRHRVPRPGVGGRPHVTGAGSGHGLHRGRGPDGDDLVQLPLHPRRSRRRGPGAAGDPQRAAVPVVRPPASHTRRQHSRGHPVLAVLSGPRPLHLLGATGRHLDNAGHSAPAQRWGDRLWLPRRWGAPRGLEARHSPSRQGDRAAARGLLLPAWLRRVGHRGQRVHLERDVHPAKRTADLPERRPHPCVCRPQHPLVLPRTRTVPPAELRLPQPRSRWSARWESRCWSGPRRGRPGTPATSR